MQLLVSYLRFVPHKTEIMQALLSFPLVNRFLAGKANRKVSYLVQKIMCECVYESKYQTNSNALEIYIYVITAGISDGPSTQHKGPRGHIQCILVGRTKASQECGRILVKHALLFKKVPLTTPPKKDCGLAITCSQTWHRNRLGCCVLGNAALQKKS